MKTGHSSIAYAAELEALRERFLLMVQRTREMLEVTIDALQTRDPLSARRVIDTDRFLDRLEVETDEKCLILLARHNPVASDLRLMVTVLKAVTDLERIGDLCTGIAKHVLALEEREAAFATSRLLRMQEVAMRMMRLAEEALRTETVEPALELLRMDDELDGNYTELLRSRFEADRGEGDSEAGLRLFLIAKNLERIGDHCTNLAEQVVFLAQSRDIRHGAGGRTRPEPGSA